MFAPGRSNCILDELFVDLLVLVNLLVAPANPIRVSSPQEILLAISGKPALEERSQKLFEQEEEVEVADI